MAELEAKLQSGGPGKDTVARVAEEFRTFRELMFEMLRLLRQQITECSHMIDGIEARHRRKALLFLGVPESGGENCNSIIIEKVNNTLGLKDISSAHVSSCHRIGTSSTGHHRPILVWFSHVDHRSAVWKAKSKFKGSSFSVREFLTKPRQAVFSKARQHFGMRAVWTQDGLVVLKTPDGTRVKITSSEELRPYTSKYPKSASSTVAIDGGGGRGGSAAISSNKSRKN
ncbi:hypothetical protein O3G_MSEX010082 [Manduca sexta]|uniref:Uncharacterized protein n=1 Tax=Manduca sexta TaxID=7130 RepID=A0A922CSS6_MANSE|nr:hypothetical protein O3G_MSEX010082 [Manduca sexta]